MDRALNADALGAALGQHAPGVLPTVEELIDLISDVEVRTFISPPAVDDQLLRAGWYLHGIASASEASELYTPVRQQRAFAVSAHIFDLALNDPNRTVHDQLTLAFGAQVGYRRADLDPNATAIWRRVDTLLDSRTFGSRNTGEGSVTHRAASADPTGREFDTPDEHDAPAESSVSESLSTMALRAGVAFLGLEGARVEKLLNAWRTETQAVADLIGLDGLKSTMFGPAEAVAMAVADLMTFLRYGDRERLRTAQGTLVSVIDLRAGQGDHHARWVAAHLLVIADGMDSSSVWSVLPKGTPDIVAQAFTVGAPPVLTLWPPQRDLLQRQALNPLDPATKRLLLSIPTSAGKTLLAQILICHHLATQPGDVCYVTPLRSLGREMRQALSGRLRVMQKGLGGDFPDFGDITIDDYFDLIGEPATSSVEIMTPERLAQMLRRDPEGILDRFSMFVVDEAQLLAQPGRGFLLESLIAMLSTTEARLVLLSGVMGNAHQIATWLDPSSPGVLFSSGWRGPRRLHALLRSQTVWKAEQPLPVKSQAFKSKARYPLIADLRVRPVEGKIYQLTTSPDHPVGELVRSVRAVGEPSNVRTPFYKLCAKTAHMLLPAGSLLMILSRRDYARNAAQEVAKLLEATPRTDELREFLEERVGKEHPIVNCVRHGVAYHHAGLPVDVLEALEQAMRSEVLLGMFATSTLTDGVNLPVRTVLICETRYEGQDPSHQLDAPRLLNAVGRAGRAGKETEGWIILGLNKAPDERDFDLLQPAADDLEIRSTLDSAHALTQLAEAEALIDATADVLFELAPGEAADFAAFVWFVLSATERLGSLASSVDLGSAVRGLLAFVQLPPELEARWIAFAEYIRGQFELTSPVSRLRWAVTGAGLSSSRTIEQLALALADQVAAQFGEHSRFGSTRGPVLTFLTTDDALDALDGGGILTRLLALPEAGNVWRFKQSVGSRGAVDVSVVHALRAWISGLNMPELAAAMLPTVPDIAWRLEQTVDAVSGAFEHFLSWTVGVVITQANELLVERGGVEAIPANLPYLIRYGVDTTTAFNLLTSGVRSRRLAYVIGNQAQSEELPWDRVREWLRSFHITGWQREFNATPHEVEDLAEFCRSTTTSPLRQLLESRTATVKLIQSTVQLPASPMQVELRVTSPADPIEVWTLESPTYPVGIVAAESHADLVLLLTSGIYFSATADGATLTLRGVQ